MAATRDIQALCDELTCSICLEYFRDPVTIVACGHNFCQACLAQCWEKGTGGSCPQCRESAQQRNFIPNRQLKNVVEIAKKLSLRGQASPREGERVCKKHQEPLQLFCTDHETPICQACGRSKEHENHMVIPWEEAFQEYKDQICSSLKILRAEREKIWMYRADAETESQDLLNQTQKEKQKIMAEFQLIHQFLKEQEKILLDQIRLVEKEIARKRDKHLAKLCRELSSLENIIQEMEKKYQQPDGEFLQDIGRTLQRYNKTKAFENFVTFPSELICRIKEFSDRKPLQEGIMKQFPANVTLDPDTAHPRLILSGDRKIVRRGHELQALPNNPERFDKYPIVLGREGFTAGRHFWEVTVKCEEIWSVGVARKSVQRKGSKMYFEPEEGIWAVGQVGDFYVAHNPLDCHPLSLSREIKSIRVTLNYDKGQVSFSYADTGVHIYTYSGASFCGETLFPFFYLFGEAHLKFCP